jgi:hypothetical protein
VPLVPRHGAAGRQRPPRLAQILLGGDDAGDLVGGRDQLAGQPFVQEERRLADPEPDGKADRRLQVVDHGLVAVLGEGGVERPSDLRDHD